MNKKESVEDFIDFFNQAEAADSIPDTSSVWFSASGTTGTGPVWVAPNTTGTTYPPYIWQPSTSPATTITIASQPETYSVFELPRKKYPMAVYVNGRMVTLGIIGSNVECAFMNNCLVFAPGVLNYIIYGHRNTLIIEYKTAFYHYDIGSDSTIKYKPNSTTVDAQLLSIIKK